MSHVTVCPIWRNYIATAPDLTVSTTKNKPVAVELHKYQRQGTHPIEPDTLARKHFQGGYLLNFKVREPPKFGVLRASPSGQGWWYYPNFGYVGEDSFYYIFNNGTQDSECGRVDITVDDGLDADIYVERLRPTSGSKTVVLRFTGSYKIPSNWPLAYDFIHITWVETRPIVSHVNGLPYAFETPYYKSSSSYTLDKYKTPVSHISQMTTPWYVYEMPTLIDAYYPFTQSPYPKPIYYPWPMALRVDFYKDAFIAPEIVDWDITVDPNEPIYEDRFQYWRIHDSIEVNVAQVRGDDWYDNGTTQWIEYGKPGWPMDLFPSGF